MVQYIWKQGIPGKKNYVSVKIHKGLGDLLQK